MSHQGNSVLTGDEPFPELLPADPYWSHNTHPCDHHSVFSHPGHSLKLVYLGKNINRSFALGSCLPGVIQASRD